MQAAPAKKDSKAKKVKKVKDPNAPKKPLSGYMLWMKEEGRPFITKNFPDLTFGESGKKAGELWRGKTDAEKAGWKR